MRLLVATLAAALLAAGCFGGSGVDTASLDRETPGAPVAPADPAPPADDPARPSDPARPTPSTSGGPPAPAPSAPEERSFCDSEAQCDFWDEEYHEYVLYQPDTHVLDVLIVPSASPGALEDTAFIIGAVEAWADGIAALGEEWFASQFRMNVYALGRDVPPQEALEDPEIVVLAAEYNPAVLFGIGLEPKQTACAALGQQSLRTYVPHVHDGWTIMAEDCTGIGFTCFAINTNFLLFGTETHLRDLVAHEFGHCLGGGHVGDALDFTAKRVPVQDIMSYQHDDTLVHCVSTLNVRVLEGLYGPLMGQDVPQALAPGEFYAMPRSEYAHVPCNP